MSYYVDMVSDTYVSSVISILIVTTGGLSRLNRCDKMKKREHPNKVWGEVWKLEIIKS